MPILDSLGCHFPKVMLLIAAACDARVVGLFKFQFRYNTQKIRISRKGGLLLDFHLRDQQAGSETETDFLFSQFKT